jgi:hypothetical protein
VLELEVVGTVSVLIREYPQIQEFHLTPANLFLVDLVGMAISPDLLNRKNRDLVHMLEIHKQLEKGLKTDLTLTIVMEVFKTVAALLIRLDLDMPTSSLESTMFLNGLLLLLEKNPLLLVIDLDLTSVETK